MPKLIDESEELGIDTEDDHDEGVAAKKVVDCNCTMESQNACSAVYNVC